MFREMRRNKQELPKDICDKILKTSSNGVLGVFGDDGYPYTVPLSYVFENGKIYFHSAEEGHKIDSIKNNPNVSFCVVSKDNVISQRFTTDYESVIVFGKARLLESKEEKIRALRLLSDKYSPKESEDSVNHEIEGSINHVAVVEIDCKYISGKKAKAF